MSESQIAIAYVGYFFIITATASSPVDRISDENGFAVVLCHAVSEIGYVGNADTNSIVLFYHFFLRLQNLKTPQSQSVQALPKRRMS